MWHMRYVIGVQVSKKDEIDDGVLVLGERGQLHPLLIHRQESVPRYKIIVFESASDAQKYAAYLSKTYRKQFKRMAKEVGSKMNPFRIYPLKADSIKFATHFTLQCPGAKSAIYIENNDSVQGQLYEIVRHTFG